MRFTTATLGLLGSALVASALPTLQQRQDTCTNDNAVVRKEWSTMTAAERLAYISGIQCIKNLPSRFPSGEIPAAENAFDDYTAVHIQLGLSVHISGTFLSWHREYLAILERQLHDDCGYPAELGLPYWDWLKYPVIDAAPMFDGSEYSLGGNGDFDGSSEPIELTPTVSLPHGTGGGCVTTGPFGNQEIRFGPFPVEYITSGVPANWTQPNPRCFTRDLNTAVVASHLNVGLVTALQASLNVAEFQNRLNPPTLSLGLLGLHRAGHLAVGTPMGDFFASPQDPAFFLHHAQVDRLWAQWQDLQPEGGVDRRYQYNGTSTTFNPPGVTPEVDNSTVIEFGPLGESITLEEAAWPNKGRYCYRYDELLGDIILG